MPKYIIMENVATGAMDERIANTTDEKVDFYLTKKEIALN